MKKLFLFSAVMFAVNLSQAQWEPDVRLTNDWGISWTSYNNARNIATSGDTVYVVWEDGRLGHFEVYFKRSLDRGITWEEDIQVTDMTGDSWEPSIVVSGSTVHVFWFYDQNGNYEIYYKRSTDGGWTWTGDTRLTNAPGDSWELSAARSGSNLHVVWEDDRDGNGDYEIYYKRSTDGGLTWETDTRLTNDPEYSGFPCVAVSGSVVHIVWEDYRDGNGEIYYISSTDGGSTWGGETRLTDAPFNSWDPCIAVSDSSVHVVWYDLRDDGTNGEIYYNRSTNGGITWGTDTRLTDVPGNALYPSIAVAGSNVHVVWYDNREGNDEIYYNHSEDAGINWGIEDIRLTDAPSYSEYPFIAISDSTVHVVWMDFRDGNDEIYYKRNPTGNLIVGSDNNLIINKDQQIRIWPNPASNIIHLNISDLAGITIENTFLTIRNLPGEELLSKQIQNGITVIDVSGLQNGLYFAEIKTGNKQKVSTKLIIQK